jgi:hypothetical protein
MLVLKWIVILIPIVTLAKSIKKSEINGKKIVCSKEAYNCPSYKGKKAWKRLKSCADVKIVWQACKSDVHGLDKDNDGKPCEKDCSF